MSDNIVEIIAQYGLETILIAVVVNIVTAIIKAPIKYFANKTKNSARITRFIVVLPLLIGFAATVCYMKLTTDQFEFGKGFVTLWLTSSSLSLTIYAVLEKMMPSKKAIIQDNETEVTEKIIEKLQGIASDVFQSNSTADTEVKEQTTSQEQAAVNETSVSRQQPLQQSLSQTQTQPLVTQIQPMTVAQQHFMRECVTPSRIILRGNNNAQSDRDK